MNWTCPVPIPFIFPLFPAAVVAPDVSWSHLAMSYELTGGLIRNAVLSALALAIKGCHGGTLVITEQHLMEGARLQLRCVCVRREQRRGRGARGKGWGGGRLVAI